MLVPGAGIEGSTVSTEFTEAGWASPSSTSTGLLDNDEDDEDEDEVDAVDDGRAVEGTTDVSKGTVDSES